MIPRLDVDPFKTCIDLFPISADVQPHYRLEIIAKGFFNSFFLMIFWRLLSAGFFGIIFQVVWNDITALECGKNRHTKKEGDRLKKLYFVRQNLSYIFGSNGTKSSVKFQKIRPDNQALISIVAHP